MKQVLEDYALLMRVLLPSRTQSGPCRTHEAACQVQHRICASPQALPSGQFACSNVCGSMHHA